MGSLAASCGCALNSARSLPSQGELVFSASAAAANSISEARQTRPHGHVESSGARCGCAGGATGAGAAAAAAGSDADIMQQRPLALRTSPKREKHAACGRPSQPLPPPPARPPSQPCAEALGARAGLLLVRRARCGEWRPSARARARDAPALPLPAPSPRARAPPALPMVSRRRARARDSRGRRPHVKSQSERRAKTPRHSQRISQSIGRGCWMSMPMSMSIGGSVR